ncbi:hypothetical protein ZWY2020_008424 [Hordeum vulgare]|nr:hypothetical protein ZWY2020_008424 [Hordeum vulgare]
MASCSPSWSSSSTSCTGPSRKTRAASGELTSLHDALGSGPDPRWADDCRELSYHADDIVDAYLAASEPAACRDGCLGFLDNLLGPRRWFITPSKTSRARPCICPTVSSMPDMEGIFDQMLRQLNVEKNYNQEAKDAVRDFLQSERLDMSHVRSITMIRCDKVFTFKHLGYLRVLNVEDCDGLDDTDVHHICGMILLKHLSLKETPQVTRLPPQIGNLRHLETLEIGLTQISVLSPQIGKLQNLETLDVRLTGVKELPKELVMLLKLANLHFGQTGVRLPAGSDCFKSVKMLGTIDSRECSASTLERLEMTGLTKAELMLCSEPADTPKNDSLLSCMGKCTSLRSLIVHGDFIASNDLPASPNFPLLEKLTVTARFVKIPGWIAHLSCLKKLEIRLFEQGLNDLKILGGIIYLESLQKVTLIYSSHCSSCAGVTETVAVLRKEAASHANRIVLSVNGDDEIFPSISSVDGKITTTRT